MRTNGQLAVRRIAPARIAPAHLSNYSPAKRPSLSRNPDGCSRPYVAELAAIQRLLTDLGASYPGGVYCAAKAFSAPQYTE